MIAMVIERNGYKMTVLEELKEALEKHKIYLNEMEHIKIKENEYEESKKWRYQATGVADAIRFIERRMF